MQRSNLFLRTKLLPPRPVPDVLDRPRLTQRLEANLALPLTLIAADAGCGKTTLIAEFIRRRTLPAVWYQLDHTDADPGVFLGYLVQGIRAIAPGFGETLLPYIEEAGGEISSVPERAADLLVSEILNGIEQPFVLVLDDYHHIGRETPVHKIVDRLLQYSSDLLHIVITTRDLPPLAMMRRRTQYPGMLITRDDLLFTDEEVRELYRKTLGVELGEADLEAYRSRTKGWVTALQLVRQVADQEMPDRKGSEPPDLAAILDRSEKDIFDYFAEEVFSREPESTRKILLSLSLLESLPLDECGRLFPDFRCSAVLPELAQKNVFLTVAGDSRSDEEYRFHPLFRDFLLRRLRAEIGREGIAAERMRIARHFLDDGKWELALPYILQAGDFDLAASVIAERGGEWIASGAFISLGSALEQIPSEVVDKFPRALLHSAEAARQQGESQRSAALLRRAAKLLHDLADREGEAVALHSLASVERNLGHLTKALELLTEAEELVEPDSVLAMKCANTRGLCLIGEGKHAEAEQQFRIALELAERHGDRRYARMITHNLALAPGYRGDFAEALKWFKRIFRGGGPDIQLPQEAIGHLNMARLHLYRGEFDEVAIHLNSSLELSQMYNLRALRGEIYEAFGNYYRDRGELAAAGEYYDRAAAAYRDADIDPNTRELNEERAKLQMAIGDRRAARSTLDAILSARRQAGNQMGIATASLLECRIDLMDRRTDGLSSRVADLQRYFHDKGNYYDEALASMLLAETHSDAGARQPAVEAVRRVLDLAERYDYDHWLRGEIRRCPDVFADEDVAERLPEDLRSEIGRPAGTVAMPAAAPVADLSVAVLGPVEIFRDPATPFAADAWTTRRSRDIFCFIATSRHRRASKDLLIDTFWTDEEPAAVEKNFHPTISHIRKALNSRQPFKQNFVIFKDGAYQLNPELAYRIDIEEFEQRIAAAEKAKRERNPAALREDLEAAHALYRGEFMQGVYDDWAAERRAYYADQFTRVLAALAKLHFAEKRVSAAQRFAAELLALDPYREDMHRLVMRSFAAQGKPAAVKQQYETLTSLLRDELGIEPSQETRSVYSDLTA